MKIRCCTLLDTLPDSQRKGVVPLTSTIYVVPVPQTYGIVSDRYVNFGKMPITDINARTHPITDTDIRYEGHSVAVARIKRPSVYAATVYGSRSRGGVGRHCPQALGQTVVTTCKQASGAKQAGRGRGRCAQPSLSGFDILINTARPTGHASLGTPSSHAAATPASQRVCSLIETRHRASTSVYSLTFCFALCRQNATIGSPHPGRGSNVENASVTCWSLISNRAHPRVN